MAHRNRYRAALVAALAGGAGSSAVAAVKNWAAPVSGNVSVGANWSPAGAPTTTDEWYINAVGTYTVTMDAPAADGSARLDFHGAGATVYVVNQGGTHTTDYVGIGASAGTLTVAFLQGTVRSEEFSIASGQANASGDALLSGATWTVEDNGIVRVGDASGADALLGLYSGAVLQEVSVPPGVDTDTGQIVVGDGCMLIVSESTIETPQFELELGDGASLVIDGPAVAEFGGVTLGPGSSIYGSGTLSMTLEDADTTASIAAVGGTLTVNDFAAFVNTATLFPGAWRMEFPETSSFLNGVGADPGVIILGGGVLASDGLINSGMASSISGRGTIEADVLNLGAIIPTINEEIVFVGELDNRGTISGGSIRFPSGSSYTGHGVVDSGFLMEAGSSAVLTGDSTWGTLADGVQLDGEIDLAGFELELLQTGSIALDGEILLSNGTLRTTSPLVIGAGGAMRNPGVVQANLSNGGEVSTNGTLTFANGGFGMLGGGTLRLRMLDEAPGGYGNIVVSAGPAACQGTLEIDFQEGFEYLTGQEFDLIAATGGRVGVFTTVNYIDARNGAAFQLVYLPNRVKLRVLNGGCDSIDFNGDGLFPDNADLADFFDVFGGGACSTGTCGDMDFNNDGLFPDNADLEAYIRVFGGGAC